MHMKMREGKVKSYIVKWLEEHYLKQEIFKPKPTLYFPYPDLAVASSDYTKIRMIIDCKGTGSNMDERIRKALRYSYRFSTAPVYIAVPEDYKKLDELKRIIETFGLQTMANVSMIKVSCEGKVTISIKPELFEEVEITREFSEALLREGFFTRYDQLSHVGYHLES